MFRRRSQRDFEDEIKAHLQLEVDRLLAQGMSFNDARVAAHKHFGSLTVAEDRFFHARRFASFDEFARDLRHALRGLLRTPAFLTTAVITLSLAMGAVAGMFAVVNTVMLRPLPFASPDRLVTLAGVAPGSDIRDTFQLQGEFYLHLKENSKLIESNMVVAGGTSTFRVNDRVERISMAWPTNDIYTTLGVRPQLGRLPRPEDDDNAVLISDRLWETWFNRDSAVVGKWYFVSDSMKQVIGVMPRDFKLFDELLWVSSSPVTQSNAGNFGGFSIARMKPGVTTEQLSAEIKQLSAQIPSRFKLRPATVNAIQRLVPITTPLKDALVGPTVMTSLSILLGAVAVVLLIACANIANLFLVRGETRKRDLTVRRAIGASRAQLMRFQLSEAFVVAAIAGVIAVVLAAITLPAFVRAAPEGIPRLSGVHMDLATVGLALGLVLVVAVVCGAAPAIRGSAPDLTGLRAGGRGSIGGRQWGRDILVVVQTAMALVLLIGSALLMQSFNRLRHVDAGYTTKDIYTFQFAPQQQQYNDGPTYGRLHLMMMDRFRALPGVTMVGVVNNIPLDEGTGNFRARAEGTTGDGIPLRLNFTGGDYFKAIGIRLLAGRAFTNDEAISPNTSTIISRSAADQLFPGQDPLGRRIYPRFGNQDTLGFTVVGVVNDVKQLSWKDKGQAAVYMPLTGPTARAWGMGSPAYVLKSTRAGLIKNEVRKIIHEVAPEAPVYREFTMEFLQRRSMLTLSFTTLTLGVLSALALVLGAVGLYGTLSYVVTQRTREIGVRMALGATARAVRAEVVKQGTTVVAVGAVIGILVAYVTTKYLASLLFEVEALDPIAFAVMAAVLLAMGVLASYMPARRASNVDPMEALRSD
jgi:putative ABC transport system permease protein